MIFPAAEVSPAERQTAFDHLRAALPPLAERAAEYLAVLQAAPLWPLAQRLLPPLSVVATSRLEIVVDQPEVPTARE